jgi:hypothetical protein
MDAKKLVTGAVVGAVAHILFGYLIFELLFGGFYEANMSGASGLMRETTLLWPMVLGSLSLAILVTLAVDKTGSDALLPGFKVGAIMGFLVWFGVHFSMYSGMELANLTVIIVDPFLELIRTGITGAVIGLVLGRFSKAEPASTG